MSIQIGICHGLANPITVEVCQVEIVNTVDEIFTLEYEEIDFQNSRYPAEQSFPQRAAERLKSRPKNL